MGRHSHKHWEHLHKSLSLKRPGVIMKLKNTFPYTAFLGRGNIRLLEILAPIIVSFSPELAKIYGPSPRPKRRRIKQKNKQFYLHSIQDLSLSWQNIALHIHLTWNQIHFELQLSASRCSVEVGLYLCIWGTPFLFAWFPEYNRYKVHIKKICLVILTK